MKVSIGRLLLGAILLLVYLDEIRAQTGTKKRKGVARPPESKKRQFSDIINANKGLKVPTLNDGTDGRVMHHGRTMALIEGDILVPPPPQRTKRALERTRYYIWETRKIPYVMDTSIDINTKTRIQEVLDYFNNHRYLCVTFLPRTTEADYINFIRGGGCYSYVGHIRGPQDVSIGNGCEYFGIISHEIMHAMGFWHEQSRPDRDAYITIKYDNIQTGKEGNFKKLTKEGIDMHESYDYESIMHYGKYDFSNATDKPTIVPIDPTADIGQTTAPSESDIRAMAYLYSCSTPEGQWGLWSPCQYAGQFRERVCFGPDPKACGGAMTSSYGTMISPDPCPLNNIPTFSDWMDWSLCSTACGPGERFRTRTCSTTEGKRCTGDFHQTEACQNTPCATWGQWHVWQPCTTSCGGGTQTRTRTCAYSAYKGAKCEGNATAVQDCNSEACPGWVEWSDWTQCTVTCGGGKSSRKRTCGNGKPGDAGCKGNEIEEVICHKEACPKWGDWSLWSNCSASCGGGKTTRVRSCNNGNPSDIGCQGNSSEHLSCNEDPCAKWSEWTDWSPCTVTCGGGQSVRNRTCQNGTPGDASCQGKSIDSVECYKEECPKWGEWGQWSRCTVTCGGGKSTRNRDCQGTNPADNLCQGNSTDQVDCHQDPCPSWSTWGQWSNCTATCGGGKSSRSRSCVNGIPNDIGCQGETVAHVNCNEDPCPKWSEWSDWSECSATCGGGQSTKNRTCKYGKPGDDGCQGNSTEAVSCHREGCPMWGTWGEWSNCTLACAGGSKTRSRTCEHGSIGDVGCQDNSTELSVCNEQPCPRWNEWSHWSSCSVTCAGGTTTRNRTCLNGKPGDKGCTGNSVYHIDCNKQVCPRWSEWGHWGDCSTSCDGGTSNRSRECQDGKIGDIGCQSNSTEQRKCGENACPKWETWGDWSQCTVTCNGGTSARNRSCEFDGEVSTDCKGNSTEQQDCNIGKCPTWEEWSKWSLCSVKCDGGISTRYRNCSNGNPGDIGCQGKYKGNMTCDENPCPKWSEWNDWSTCPVTCEGGIASRSRVCGIDGANSSSCNGNSTENRKCNKKQCPKWSHWSQWSTTTSVDGETLSRDRQCLHGDIGDVGCEGDSKQTKPNYNACEWQSWSSCSVLCGGGMTSRSKEPKNTSSGIECKGITTETKACNNKDCPEGTRDCDFEDGFCGWNTTFKHNSWKLIKEHGCESEAYASATSVRSKQRTYKLVGPEITDKAPGGDWCLSFAWRIIGRTCSRIEVFASHKHYDRIVWKKIMKLKKSAYSGWMESEANLHMKRNFQIVLKAKLASRDSEVALDDIALTEGPCLWD